MAVVVAAVMNLTSRKEYIRLVDWGGSMMYSFLQSYIFLRTSTVRVVFHFIIIIREFDDASAAISLQA